MIFSHFIHTGFQTVCGYKIKIKKEKMGRKEKPLSGKNLMQV